jgi:hypothetical protein
MRAAPSATLVATAPARLSRPRPRQRGRAAINAKVGLHRRQRDHHRPHADTAERADQERGAKAHPRCKTIDVLIHFKVPPGERDVECAKRVLSRRGIFQACGPALVASRRTHNQKRGAKAPRFMVRKSEQDSLR